MRTQEPKDRGLLYSRETKPGAWRQFRASGFSNPVCGVVYRSDAVPCCGVPLGGIGTGCIDPDPRGV